MEHVLFVSEFDALPLLTALIEGEQAGLFSREEVEDALACLVFDATLARGEAPTDETLVEAMRNFFRRVDTVTRREEALDVPARIRRYFELRPLSREVLEAVKTHFGERDSDDAHAAQSRAAKLLGSPSVLLSTTAPKGGVNWLQIRSSRTTNDND